MARNMVLEGEYKNKVVTFSMGGKVYISLGLTKKLYLNTDTVESYEVVNEEAQKSMSSGLMRGLVGGALLGPVGALAGGLSAKSKNTYLVAVQFKDGKRSLLELDNSLYKLLIQKLF